MIKKLIKDKISSGFPEPYASDFVKNYRSEIGGIPLFKESLPSLSLMSLNSRHTLSKACQKPRATHTM